MVRRLFNKYLSLCLLSWQKLSSNLSSQIEQMYFVVVVAATQYTHTNKSFRMDRFLAKDHNISFFFIIKKFSLDILLYIYVYQSAEKIYTFEK